MPPNTAAPAPPAVSPQGTGEFEAGPSAGSSSNASTLAEPPHQAPPEVVGLKAMPTVPPDPGRLVTPVTVAMMALGAKGLAELAAQRPKSLCRACMSVASEGEDCLPPFVAPPLDLAEPCARCMLEEGLQAVNHCASGILDNLRVALQESHEETVAAMQGGMRSGVRDQGQPVELKKLVEELCRACPRWMKDETTLDCLKHKTARMLSLYITACRRVWAEGASLQESAPGLRVVADEVLAQAEVLAESPFCHVGHPLRPSLVVLQALAARVFQDAVGDLPAISLERQLADELLKKLARSVLEDLRGIVQERSTLYQAAVELAPSLAQYTLLLRALDLTRKGQSTTWIQHEPGLPPRLARGDETIAWEDGLDRVRRLLAVNWGGEGAATAAVGAGGEREPLEVKLDTLEKLEWYATVKGLGRDVEVSALPAAVRVYELLDMIGFPLSLQQTVGAASCSSVDLKELRSLVLPAVRGEAEVRLNALLGGVDVRLRHGDTGWGRHLTCLARLKKQHHHVGAVAAGSDGAFYSGGYSDCAVKKWVQGECTATQSVGTAVTALAVAPDGSVYTGLASGAIEHWQIQGSAFQCLATLTGHTGAVYALVFCPDGVLISGSADATLRQWTDGSCTATLSGHTKAVYAVVWRQDGTLYSGSADKTIRQWPGTGIFHGHSSYANALVRGRCTGIFHGHSSSVNTLVLGLDGSTVISGGADHTIKVWRGGLCVTTLVGHAAAVRSLAVSVDGTLISADWSGTIKLWQKDQCVATCEKAGDCFYCNSLAVDRKGTLITGAWSSSNGEVAFWQHGPLFGVQQLPWSTGGSSGSS